MKENVLNIETIHQCNCCSGNKTLHPLISVIHLSASDLTQHTVKFDFYTVLLIEGEVENFQYGRKCYDYSNASMLFLSPGASVTIDTSKMRTPKGWLLAFHPALLCSISLNEHIRHYTFFSYHPDEALHLSQREKNKVIECLNNIRQELEYAIDRYSKKLICQYIELLLDYCSRFYERQFITRNEAHKAILAQADLLLDKYITSGQLQSRIFPTIESCSSSLHLSPDYFNDLLKLETGKTFSEYFQQKRLKASENMLLDSHNTINAIAEQLGFPNVSYFNKLFKQLNGITPDKFRTQN